MRWASELAENQREAGRDPWRGGRNRSVPPPNTPHLPATFGRQGGAGGPLEGPAAGVPLVSQASDSPALARPVGPTAGPGRSGQPLPGFVSDRSPPAPFACLSAEGDPVPAPAANKRLQDGRLPVKLVMAE